MREGHRGRPLRARTLTIGQWVHHPTLTGQFEKVKSSLVSGYGEAVGEGRGRGSGGRSRG